MCACVHVVANLSFVRVCCECMRVCDRYPEGKRAI